MALLFKSNRNKLRAFQVGGTMPEVPVYAYYKPQYTEYKPFDLAGLYQKYAALTATKANDKAEAPKLDDLVSVGLPNESRMVGEQALKLRGEIDLLSRMPGAATNPILRQRINDYGQLISVELPENKIHKENWDLNKKVLVTQGGDETPYFKNGTYVVKTEVEDPNTKKKITQYVKKTPEQLVDEKTGLPTKDFHNVITYQDLAILTANDPNFVRSPELIDDLQQGMDLSHINKEFVQPILKNSSFTESGVKTSSGGMIKGDVLVEEVSSGHISKNNFQQLNSALDAVFTDVMNSKAKNSLTAYAYRQPAKEAVESKDAQGNTVVKYETKYVTVTLPDGTTQKRVKATTTQEEADLNIKLYLLGQSKPFKNSSFTQEEKSKYDFLAVPKLKVEEAKALNQTESPLVLEATNFRKEDTKTLDIGGGMKYNAKVKEVGLAKNAIKAGLASQKGVFDIGDLSKAELQDGTTLNATVGIAGGDPGKYDNARIAKLKDITLLKDTELQSATVPMFNDGTRVTWEKFVKLNGGDYVKEYRKRINPKMSEARKGEIFGEFLVEKNLAKMGLVWIATGVVHRNSYLNTPSQWTESKVENSDGKIIPGLSKANLMSSPVDPADINAFLTSLDPTLEDGELKRAQDLLDDQTDVNDFRYVRVYIPFADPFALSANDANNTVTPGSFKYSTNSRLDDVRGSNQPKKKK